MSDIQPESLWLLTTGFLVRTQKYGIMLIREATIIDVDALVLLASQTFIDTYDDLFEEESTQYRSESFSKDSFRQNLEDSKTWIMVSESLFQ